MPRKRTLEQPIFALLAGGCVLGAAYHAAGAVAPGLGIEGARWRHGLFVGIDLLGAWYFIRRPVWLIPAFVALVVQQFYGHGSRLLVSWQADRPIDRVSLVVLTGFVIALPLILRDAWSRYRPVGQQSRMPTA